jgi:Tfp pilus assembly protein PilF
MLDFYRQQLKKVEDELQQFHTDRQHSSIETEGSYALLIRRLKKEREELLKNIQEEENRLNTIKIVNYELNDTHLPVMLEELQKQLALSDRRTDLAKQMLLMNGLFDNLYEEHITKIKEGGTYKKEFDPKNFINSLFDEILFGNTKDTTRNFIGKLSVRTQKDIQEVRNDKKAFHYWQRSVIVSGITLSLAIEYDIEKINLLIDFINDREQFVWKKALVGLFLIWNKHQNKLDKETGLITKLQNLRTQPDVQYALIQIGLGFETFEEDIDMTIQFVSGTKFQDHMDFFEIPQHWFIPFYDNNAILNESSIKEPLKSLLTNSVSWQFDAIKYAFSKNFEHYSEWQKSNTVTILDKEKRGIYDAYQSELKYIYGDENDPMTAAKLHHEIQYYIQELYYFFFAFPKDLFRSLFEEKIHFFNNSISEIITTAATRLQLKAEAFYNMGSAYNDKGDKDKAIECYEKAIEIKPDKHEAFNNMGLAYSNKGDKDKAIECYQKAIEIKPDFHEAYVNLGFYLIKFGKIEDAKPILLKAIELGDLDTSNMNLGHVYLCKNEEAKALECYQTSLSHFENKDVFWKGMKDDYQYLAQYGITETYYQTILEKIG